MFRSQEQSNFNSIVSKHMAQSDAPLLLEGATGIGKTRAYLFAVMDAVEAGQKIAIALPSHQLIEQLLASSDLLETQRKGIRVIAFKPARMYENRKEYKDYKELALDSEVMLCTSASIIIDQRLNGEYNGATKRDYIIFDEADQLPDAAALQSDYEITKAQLKELSISAQTAEQVAKEILKKKHLEPEVKASAIMILEAIEEPAWFYKAGLTDDGGVKLFHKMPGRLLKKIANRNKVAFISATLSINGKFDDFKRSMGIQKESNLSCMIEPVNHGQLAFEVTEVAVNTPEWLEIIQSTINTAPKPLLVVTPSHELSKMLGEIIPNTTIRSRDETSTEASKRMGDTEILIASGAWAGLDTPIKWASIVVPRIPYDRPIVLDGEIESSFLDTRNTALRRMRQVIGRGLRTPDAVCNIFVLDGRYKNIEAFIPDRFKNAWNKKLSREGKRYEVTLSKLERDPTVRKRALKHYGQTCMSCKFSPKVISQLDVHHLNPLADGGERLTSIEDVAVLCANCHRLSHSTIPPLTVEAMKVFQD